MNVSCKFSKDNYNYVIELSPSEYQEILDLRAEINDKKQQLADTLYMFEKLEPSRVHKIPKQIQLDDVLETIAKTIFED